MPTRYSIGPIAGAVIACLAVAARSEELTPIALKPSGWFRTPEAGGSWSMNGFRAIDGRLYFMFATAPIETLGHSAVIETDLRGSVLRRLDLPGARIEQFAVGPTGRIAAFLREGDLSRSREVFAMVWDEHGTLERRLEVKTNGSLTFHAGRPFSIRGEEMAPIDGAVDQPGIVLSGASGQQPDVFADFLLPLPGMRTAVVSPLAATMAVVEGDAVTRDIQFAAPEIQGVVRRGDLGQLTLSSCASDDGGKIWCAVSPYKRTVGPPLLQFDEAGQLRNRYVLAPVEGAMSPGKIAATGGELFVASAGTVLWYTIP